MISSARLGGTGTVAKTDDLGFYLFKEDHSICLLTCPSEIAICRLGYSLPTSERTGW